MASFKPPLTKPESESKTAGRDANRGPFLCDSPPDSSRKRDRLLVFSLVSLASFLFYLCLLPPSISRGGDCGELIAASYTLGIGHPSGYSIWCLLGRIFALIPIGEIAWRYNLFSAVCGALAAGTIAAAAHRLLDQEENRLYVRCASVGTGLLFTGFFSVGTQALLAEVYAIAALEGAALLYFALAWKQHGDWRNLATFTFLAGISPLVHLSGVFLWPILGVWVLWKQKGLTAPRLLTLFALFVSGWIMVLYFPIRSAAFPVPPNTSLDHYLYFPLDWGHPTALFSLKNHVTARQYNGLLKPLGLVGTAKAAVDWVSYVSLQYLWATPILVAGAIAAFKRRCGAVLLFIFIFNVIVEMQYDVSDQTNFFFPAYLVMALWMALGWHQLFFWLESWGRKLARGQQTSLWPWRLRVVGLWTLFATIGAQWYLFSTSASGRGIFRPRDGALEATQAAQKLALRDKRPVAALYTDDDGLWPFWYVQFVLGTAPNVQTPWGRGLRAMMHDGTLSDYVAQLKKGGPVVLGQWDERTDARFPLVMLTPSGNLCEASDLASPPPAVPLETPIKKATPGPNGLLAARFRHAALWRNPNGVTSLAPANMAAFEVDFRCAPGRHGFIDVLMVKKEALDTKIPSPTQGSVNEGDEETGTIPVSRQHRRFIVPPGEAGPRIWRTAVPIQVEANSPVGDYQIWTRLVASETDTHTPWTHTDGVHLTAR